MRLMTRYVLIEFIKVFLITLLSLTLLMLIVGVIKEALDEGLGPRQVLPLLPYVLPNALLFTVPATSLFAACAVYGRMSGCNEVVALKSLGISPAEILKPCLVAGFLLSLVTVWLNDVAWSWGYAGVQRVAWASGEDIIYSMLRSQRSYSCGRCSIAVKAVEERKLVQPTIVLQDRRNGQTVVIRAAEAELRSDLQAGILSIICRDSVVEIDGTLSGRVPEALGWDIDLADLRQEPDASSVSAAHLTLSELGEAIDRQRSEIDAFDRELAAEAALAMLTGDFATLAAGELGNSHLLRQARQRGLDRFRTEPYRRWANGFSCLCFVFVGAAVAIRLRNADFLTSFFACFLPVLVVYYPIFTFGIDRAKNGALPPYSVWLGNVILAACGGWVWRKVMRY